MKKETLEKILSGEKKTFRVNGYTYYISIFPNERRVELEPCGRGTTADSDVDVSSYRYTHGGETYRLAVDIAKEIANTLPKDTDN